MRAILVDDEATNSGILGEILNQYCPTVEICGKAEDIALAEQLIRKEDPHVLFLDIQLPKGSGFDLLDRIGDRKLEVIFVTAYDNFLLRAIRYSALDYILKPINIPDLILAVQRAEQRIASASATQQLNVLLANMRQPSQVHRIAIPHKDAYIFITISEIERLEARGAYTEIFAGGKNYMVSKNIKEYEDLLPETLFCRVHHSHLVNINHIKTYHKGRGGYIEMISGTCIEVSVRRKEDFLNRFR